MYYCIIQSPYQNHIPMETKEAIILEIAPDTLKGIIIGGIVTSVIAIVIYQIAMQLSGRGNYHGGYPAYDDFPPAGPLTHQPRRRRRQNGTLLGIIISIIIVFLLLIGRMFTGNSLSEQTTSTSMRQDVASITFIDDEMHNDTSEPGAEIPSEMHLISNTTDLQETHSDNYAEIVVLKDYVQVAALANEEKGIRSLAKYQSQYTGQVYLARSNLPEAYPVKVLIGPFPNESDARAAAKKIKGHHKNLDQNGLVLLTSTQSERMVY